MTAHAHISGHPVVFDESAHVWRWEDSGEIVNHERGCSRCGQAVVTVSLCHPTSRGFTEAAVDACLAPFVAALNTGGLQTIASCCGHGDGPGTVILEDGRELLVFASIADRCQRVGHPWTPRPIGCADE